MSKYNNCLRTYINIFNDKCFYDLIFEEDDVKTYIFKQIPKDSYSLYIYNSNDDEDEDEDEDKYLDEYLDRFLDIFK